MVVELKISWGKLRVTRARLESTAKHHKADRYDSGLARAPRHTARSR
jgi:hypothetical protein